MSVTVTKDGMAAFERAVRDLVKNQVLVGVPAEGATREPEKGEKTSINNATIGYLMEYGQPERNLPARSHLIPGIQKAQPKLTARLLKAGQAALSGDSGAVDAGLHAVGLEAQNAVRGFVTDGAFAPLSQRTLEARRARGRSGTKPLIDTGQYRRSLTYVVRPKGASSVMTDRERASKAGREAVASALAAGNFETNADRASREGLNAVANALGLKS